MLSGTPSTSRSSASRSEIAHHTIRSLLAESVKELDGINREIHGLQEKRDKVAAQILSYRIEISPWKKAPHEIIGEIFTHVGNGKVSVPIHVDEFPWALGQVCSRWRQILHSTPGLWTSVEISHRRLNEGWPTWLKHAEATLDAIILRRNGPISFTFPETYRNYKVPTLELVFPRLSHLKGLTIERLFYEDFQKVMCLPPGSFPSLETLDFCIGGFRVAELPARYNTSLFKVAPNLRRVSIDFNDIHPIPAPAISLPLTQLISLCISQSTPDIWNILEQSVSIVHLQITIHKKPDFLRSEIIHKNLKSLLITTVYEMDWDGFFGHLVLPSLRELRVTCSSGEWGHTWTPEIIISLIKRSQCNIDTLVIHDKPRIDPVRVHPAMNSLLRHLTGGKA